MAFGRHWVGYYATTFHPRDLDFDSRWEAQFELWRDRVLSGDIRGVR